MEKYAKCGACNCWLTPATLVTFTRIHAWGETIQTYCKRCRRSGAASRDWEAYHSRMDAAMEDVATDALLEYEANLLANI